MFFPQFRDLTYQNFNSALIPGHLGSEAS